VVQGYLGVEVQVGAGVAGGGVGVSLILSEVTDRYARAARVPRRVSLAVVLALAGCARTPPEGPALPAPEGEAIAAELARQTQLADTAQIFFDWVLSEQGRRGTGKGTARVQSPDRARLDLFLNDLTTVARAVLVEDQVQATEALPEGSVPPAELLWATLGVFRPTPGSTLESARLVGEETELRYTSGGQELRFRVRGQQLQRAELRQGGSLVHQVVLEPGQGARYPREATYQNRAQFRELKLTTTSIEDADAFPADIWTPTRP
jgi:hypothetical protein